jgi:hypothetical protein
MSDSPTSDDLLSRLKEQIHQRRENPSGSFITVTANEMNALVKCAEALKRAHVFYQRLAEAGCIDDGEHSKEARWELQDEMGGALAKLEPL